MLTNASLNEQTCTVVFLSSTSARPVLQSIPLPLSLYTYQVHYYTTRSTSGNSLDGLILSPLVDRNHHLLFPSARSASAWNLQAYPHHQCSTKDSESESSLIRASGRIPHTTRSHSIGRGSLSLVKVSCTLLSPTYYAGCSPSEGRLS